MKLVLESDDLDQIKAELRQEIRQEIIADLRAHGVLAPGQTVRRGWLTVEQAAGQLSCKPKRIYYLVRRWLNPDYLEAAKRTQHGVPWTVQDLRAGRVLIEESERRRFVNADALDRTVLTAKQLQELTVLLAQPE